MEGGVIQSTNELHNIQPEREEKDEQKRHASESEFIYDVKVKGDCPKVQ